MSAIWLDRVAPLVRQAGGIARRRLFEGGAKAERKTGGDWVTNIDREIEQFLSRHLRDMFPGCGIIGEEGGASGDLDNCWVIDPLDGTTNFVHGMPCCAVSLAYCKGGRPQLAVVCDIAADMLYTAAAGSGAYCERARLRLPPDIAYHNTLFIASGQMNAGGGDLWGFAAQLSRRTDGMRRTGSSVLDMAWLAAGNVGAVISGPVNYWDVAAGALLVREAGGLICDINDRTEFIFNQPTASFVAAAPKAFPRLFTELKQHLQPTNPPKPPNPPAADPTPQKP